MKYYPSIDLGRCSRCFGCLETAPEVFSYDPVTGMIVIADLHDYAVQLVDEAIKNCPRDCIKWEVFQLSQQG